MQSHPLRHLCVAAAFAALAAGLLLTLVQQVRVVPDILEAESYEEAAAAGQVHEHAEAAWEPADGAERFFFTAAANLVIALGFALLLGAAIQLHGSAPDWRQGLLWGAAGFAVFHLAPTLGLPPELPGTQAAALHDRQLWWLGTVAASAAGLALLVFGHGWLPRLAGVALLVAPHLIGAPRPDRHHALAPRELAESFETASLVANALFWLALGAAYGFFHRRTGQ